MPRCGNRKTQSPGSVGAGGRAGRSVGRSWCPPRSGGDPLTRTGLKQGRRFLLDPVRCFPSGTPGSSHFRPHHVRCSYPTARRASPRCAAQPKAHSRQASLPCNPPSGNGSFQLLIDTPPSPPHPHPAMAPSISHHCCEQAHSERTISARAESPPSGPCPSLLASGHCRGFLSGGFYSGHQSSFW